jgi:hypothetical protein
MPPFNLAEAIDQRMSGRSGIRFADKDMRQHENLRRFPVILDHQYHREALWAPLSGRMDS